MSHAADDADRFTALFTEYAPRVHAYVSRRCAASAVEEVVAEAFLVAWRRWSEVPDAALPWLLVVARNLIGNQRRSQRRQMQLTDLLASQPLATAVQTGEQVVIGREVMIAALSELSRVNWKH